MKMQIGKRKMFFLCTSSFMKILLLITTIMLNFNSVCGQICSQTDPMPNGYDCDGTVHSFTHNKTAIDAYCGITKSPRSATS